MGFCDSLYWHDSCQPGGHMDSLLAGAACFQLHHSLPVMSTKLVIQIQQEVVFCQVAILILLASNQDFVRL